MNINKVFAGNYLKADDLAGRTVAVTIEKVEVKDFDDGNKIILTFQGKDKSLVCNKTNASIIAENLGSPDTDKWVNGRIQLTVKKVEFQGNLVPAIRVVLVDKSVTVQAPVAPAHGILGKPATRTEPADQDGSVVDDDVGF